METEKKQKTLTERVEEIIKVGRIVGKYDPDSTRIRKEDLKIYNKGVYNKGNAYKLRDDYKHD